MNAMDEFQAKFDHPPCKVCGEPMTRSCMCLNLGPWLDAGKWHCSSYYHSYVLPDPDPVVRAHADRNYDHLFNHLAET